MVSDNSLQALRQCLARDRRPGACDESGVRRLWWGALEILQEELLDRDAQEGIWLASPLPALYEPELLARLQGWVLAPETSIASVRPMPSCRGAAAIGRRA